MSSLTRNWSPYSVVGLSWFNFENSGSVFVSVKVMLTPWSVRGFVQCWNILLTHKAIAFTAATHVTQGTLTCDKKHSYSKISQSDARAWRLALIILRREIRSQVGVIRDLPAPLRWVRVRLVNVTRTAQKNNRTATTSDSPRLLSFRTITCKRGVFCSARRQKVE